MPKSRAALITKFKYKEIKQTFRKAHYIHSSPELDIKIAPATENFGKLLIVVPKKVGKAPMRNLIRRRLKSIFYENQLYTLPNNFLIFCKTPILNLSYIDLKQRMLNLIKIS